jgi:hypothetical protein
MIGRKRMMVSAMLALSMGLMASPALGKCSRECKTFLAGRKSTCLDLCSMSTSLDKKGKRLCKNKIYCKPAFKSWRRKCNKATDTTVATNCGSPSAAFLDS